MQLHQKSKSLTEAEFLRLIQEKSGSFYRVAYGYVHHAEDAKDVVQEAVCKAYVSMGRLKDADKFYPWFYRILTNTALSHLRRSSRFQHWQMDWEDARGLAQEEQWGDKIWLQEALHCMDPQSRTVIVLKVYECMTFYEIAQVLKKTENTVKSIYYRGLKTMRERMQVNGC